MWRHKAHGHVYHCKQMSAILVSPLNSEKGPFLLFPCYFFDGFTCSDKALCPKFVYLIIWLPKKTSTTSLYVFFQIPFLVLGRLHTRQDEWLVKWTIISIIGRKHVIDAHSWILFINCKYPWINHILLENTAFLLYYNNNQIHQFQNENFYSRIKASNHKSKCFWTQVTWSIVSKQDDSAVPRTNVSVSGRMSFFLDECL